SLPPLFCVHGHFGEVLFYRPLSQLLGSEQPFFALQAVEHNGSTLHQTIEAKAEMYLAAIRTAQPRGPYYIAGYCFGAMVAFEMAHQLQRQGEKVAFLGLFMGRDSDLNFGTRIFNRLEQHIEQFQRHGWKSKLHELRKNTATKVQSAFWNVRYTL